MHKIARLVAREILDSRGNPTVEAEVFTDTGAVNEQSLHSLPVHHAGRETQAFQSCQQRNDLNA